MKILRFTVLLLLLPGCQATPLKQAPCTQFDVGSCADVISLHEAATPKSMFGDAGHAKLFRVAEFLKANPGIRVNAEGHVNSSGDTDEELSRSERIAIYAREYLVAHGVESSRIETIAFGAEKPAREPSSKLENLRFNATFYDPHWCGSDVKADCHSPSGE
ncbi:MAG: OmpA family protein [Bdellovibrionota bacterium]